jgi:sorting nexin-4
MVQLYIDTSAVYAELGALYNGWSLQEHQLSEAIEQVGQAIDSTLTSTTILYTSLEERFGDVLLEYEKFSSVIHALLMNRHRAHLEFENVSENLILKQQMLQKLETSEHESQRLAAILSVEGQPQIPISKPTGILATLNSLIDNDPEQTRRNTISKTKDTIQLLEEQREETRVKLLDLNSEIQRDLDRFQKQKVSDVKNMLVAFCLAQKEYHSRAIAAWRGTKDSISRIET